MLFNSYAFVFAFLPLSLLIYHALRRMEFARGSIFALTLCSLFFYGWWNPLYLLLIVPLILANFGLVWLIMPRASRSRAAARAWLIAGVAGNLAVLGWFKYANFFVDNANALLGLDLYLAKIVLPLGICFAIRELGTLQPIHIWIAILVGHMARCALSVLRFNQGQWRTIRVDLGGTSR